jgi:hypothetical protein
MSRVVKVAPAANTRKKASAVYAGRVLQAINDQVDRVYQAKNLCDVTARAIGEDDPASSEIMALTAEKLDNIAADLTEITEYLRERRS